MSHGQCQRDKILLNIWKGRYFGIYGFWLKNTGIITNQEIWKLYKYTDLVENIRKLSKIWWSFSKKIDLTTHKSWDLIWLEYRMIDTQKGHWRESQKVEWIEVDHGQDGWLELKKMGLRGWKKEVEDRRSAWQRICTKPKLYKNYSATEWGGEY